MKYKRPQSFNPYAYGGDLTEYTAGGSHEMNPNGGIPIGGGASVEQGETKFNEFIFSDRLRVNKTLAKEFNLPDKAVGMTFAEVSKLFEDSERPNDPAANRMKNKELGNLMEAQESYKQASGLEEPNMQMAYGGHNPGSTGGYARMHSSMAPAYRHLYNTGEVLFNYSGFSGQIPAGRWNGYEAPAPGAVPANPTAAPAPPPRPQEQMVNLPNLPMPRAMEALPPPVGGLPNRGMGSPTTPVDEAALYSDFYGPRDAANIAGGMPALNSSMGGVGDALNMASNIPGLGFLRTAPAIFEGVNFLRQQFNRPEAKPLDQFHSKINYTPNLVDREQIRRDINSQSNAGAASLQNSTNGNAGAYMANLLGQKINANKAIAGANLQADMTDQAELARVQQLRGRQDMFNQQMSMQTANMNDMDAQNFLASSMDSFAQIGQNLGNMGIDRINARMAANLPTGYYLDKDYNMRYDPNRFV